MAQSDNPRYQYEKERSRIESELPTEPAEDILDLLDALDGQVRTPAFVHEGEKTEFQSSSLQVYGQRLRLLSIATEHKLRDLTNDSIDELMAGLLDGSHDLAPSGGYAPSTVGQYESALIAFYRYHDGHDVDPEAIHVEASDSTKVDERDLWTVEEIQAMRGCITSKLDECIFELLAYTGQRIRVIATLRVKDVDPAYGDTGRYYVNEGVEGRKNREGHGPLLGARGAVRRWLQVHPTKKPEDALITVWPAEGDGPENPRNGTPGVSMSHRNIRRRLETIRDRAGIDKRVNPHMFRHYFTTVALRPPERGGFGMDPQYVKRLRGDAPGSTVMETTYAHLIDEDAAAHAEAAFTGEPVETAMTPAGPCDNCGNMLDAGDKACPVCGSKRALDAEEGEVELLRRQVEELRELVSSGS